MCRFSLLPIVVTVLLSVSFPASAAQINLQDREWALLTVPANADIQSIESLFSDNLPIDSLGSLWAIYRYSQETQGYIAATRSDSLKQGEGFWIVQATGNPVTIGIPSCPINVSPPKGVFQHPCRLPTIRLVGI